ncbi:YheT family hydrolase [Poritiphilus flavus]|uniref:Alpha/beta fold hydrolase n=1 Tax=Poritiphilus flavus TaxID=2697053 RepID=A0A6L9ED46_9FLAO|nr:alpha/beta fold hydrolase [Poritiphilus flavus]NAS12543.1 alpha/beta fold hydrolase [Poritiphilus flavus]
MPTIPSAYRAPLLFRNGHIATIYSGLIRKVNGLHQTRERMELPDGDFMDLDWSYASVPTPKVVILLHGLEGNGQRPYITGSARTFNAHSYDACAVNFRGCSGETNRLYRSYHSGATEDLDAVVRHILVSKKYNNIVIKGFSLGGNMTLKYLGEGRKLPKELRAGIAVSAPCSLHSSLIQLLSWNNLAYAIRFKNHLIAKLRAKQQLYPELIPDSDIEKIRTLKDFDDVYTSRAHGFEDALDYYRQCSSLQFLHGIELPSLILNAKNDSFLGPECYPFEVARGHRNLFLETPSNGGHVGFHDKQNVYYNEKRAIKFLEEVL